MEAVDVLLVEPFYTGSHAEWCEGIAEHSAYRVELIYSRAGNWKWLMHAAAVELADKANALPPPRLYVASDLMDLSLFKSLLTGQRREVPILLYFHENQLMYPRSQRDTDVLQQRDNHYGFINYTSCLVADRIAFNSEFHRRGFFGHLKEFLASFPDSAYHRKKADGLLEKSGVLYPGIGVSPPSEKTSHTLPVLLWNHRWEHDKNPQEFFDTLFELDEEGVAFKLIVLGEQFKNSPEIFAVAKERLKPHILHWGYVSSKQEYLSWVCRADIVPVTSLHDFFGVSVVEAIRCGVFPLLPHDLAYPEHIPEALKAICLYNRGAFKEALKKTVLNYPEMDTAPLTRHVAAYDWPTVIEQYDAVFGEFT